MPKCAPKFGGVGGDAKMILPKNGTVNYRHSMSFESPSPQASSHSCNKRSFAPDSSRSLQHAAEQMTPAVLSGYDRWKPQGLSCAAIFESSHTPPIAGKPGIGLGNRDSLKGEVQGFLIFGLTEEALKCCDKVFGSPSSLNKAYGESLLDLDRPSVVFSRQLVNVSFNLKGGEVRTVDATTYVSTSPLSTEERIWDINNFVRSRAFNRYLLVSEENELAKIMGITIVLPGDALSDAVSRGNVKAVTKLLKQGNDVNSPVRHMAMLYKQLPPWDLKKLFVFCLNGGLK